MASVFRTGAGLNVKKGSSHLPRFGLHTTTSQCLLSSYAAEEKKWWTSCDMQTDRLADTSQCKCLRGRGSCACWWWSEAVWQMQGLGGERLFEGSCSIKEVEATPHQTALDVELHTTANQYHLSFLCSRTEGTLCAEGKCERLRGAWAQIFVCVVGWLVCRSWRNKTTITWRP